MSNNIFVGLRKLLPPSPVLVGEVIEINEDDDTSTVELPTQQGVLEYADGVSVGSRIRARGTFVPVGEKAFVRDGVIESRAPSGEIREFEIGGVAVESGALAFEGPISGQNPMPGVAFSVSLAQYWVGGQRPLTYSIAGGTLPAGLTFNAFNGVVSGSTAAAGTFPPVVFRATDMLSVSKDSNPVGWEVGANFPLIVAKPTPGGGVVRSDNGGASFSAQGASIPGGGAFAYGDDKFVQVQTNLFTNQSIRTSLDGVTWTQRTAPSTNSLEVVAFGAGVFVATRYEDGISHVDYSADGISWTARALPNNQPFGYLQGVSFAVDRFLVTAYADLDTDEAFPGGATSPDGFAWTWRNVPTLSAPGGNQVAAGTMLKCGPMYVLVSNSEPTTDYLTTEDFITFTRRTAPFQIAGYRQHQPPKMFGMWFVNSSGGLAATADGLSWSVVLAGSWVAHATDDVLIARGTSGVRHSSNGTAWTSVSGANVGFGSWGLAYIPPPVVSRVSNPDPQALTLEAPFSIAMAPYFTDSEAGALTYSAPYGDDLALPTGLTLNIVTGVISGAPTGDMNQDTIIRATNSRGQYAEAQVVFYEAP